MEGGAFKVGDIVNVGAIEPKRGKIVQFRMSNFLAQRTPPMIGADVMLEDGNVRFAFLHDLARANPEAVKAAFNGVTMAEVARALREVTDLVVAYRDAHPDTEVPSGFDPASGSDTLGRARSLLTKLES